MVDILVMPQSTAFARIINRLVMAHNPIILFIQETNLKVFDSSVFCSLGGSLLTKGVGQDAFGSTGGLITLWNDDLFKVWFSVEGELVSVGKSMVFCNVYALNVERDRKSLWVISPTILSWSPKGRLLGLTVLCGVSDFVVLLFVLFGVLLPSVFWSLLCCCVVAS